MKFLYRRGIISQQRVDSTTVHVNLRNVGVDGFGPGEHVQRFLGPVLLAVNSAESNVSLGAIIVEADRSREFRYRIVLPARAVERVCPIDEQQVVRRFEARRRLVVSNSRCAIPQLILRESELKSWTHFAGRLLDGILPQREGGRPNIAALVGEDGASDQGRSAGPDGLLELQASQGFEDDQNKANKWEINAPLRENVANRDHGRRRREEQ